MSPAIINQIFPSILDGNFRLRIERASNGGDFFLGGAAQPFIDANLASQAVTEPDDAIDDDWRPWRCREQGQVATAERALERGALNSR